MEYFDCKVGKSLQSVLCSQAVTRLSRQLRLCFRSLAPLRKKIDYMVT